MTKTITTLAATITLAASLLTTGCTADVAPEVDLDDSSCIDDGCVDAAEAHEGASIDRPTLEDPKRGDLSVTSVQADLFQGDWPIEEMVLEAYEGQLAAADRARIDQLIAEGSLSRTEYALARFAQRLDDGSALTMEELRVIAEIERQLDELIHQK